MGTPPSGALNTRRVAIKNRAMADLSKEFMPMSGSGISSPGQFLVLS